MRCLFLLHALIWSKQAHQQIHLPSPNVRDGRNTQRIVSADGGAIALNFEAGMIRPLGFMPCETETWNGLDVHRMATGRQMCWIPVCY
ncbi:hypothetical protein B0H67DRAFT_46528 [Lasiosphaeris hirsuta]|uniref:Secreted protein n=1 Tax=Lasiosphaeris hirsuta TaxID=260670 RepID=A0AA40BAP6_9PEZI|nr:hypothetical protein B0H67DRAFT_46528 [Lasiosphaeris hirsuta]